MGVSQLKSIQLVKPWQIAHAREFMRCLQYLKNLEKLHLDHGVFPGIDMCKIDHLKHVRLREKGFSREQMILWESKLIDGNESTLCASFGYND